MVILIFQMEANLTKELESSQQVKVCIHCNYCAFISSAVFKENVKVLS